MGKQTTEIHILQWQPIYKMEKTPIGLTNKKLNIHFMIKRYEQEYLS